MLTYVINTSENKSFDSEKLFNLAGYSKIRWMSCTLDNIKACADSIYEKQNVLGADKFRIAVIVDFYSFDRIRMPYGRRGFGQDYGVDLSLYMPYIEVFLLDNLVGYLEKKDLCSSDFEIYYIQNEKCEQYELLDSAQEQLKQILSGTDLAYTRTRTERKVIEPEIPAEGRPPKFEEELNGSGEQIVDLEVQEDYYRAFNLYCTSAVSLTFRMSDYPYGADEMTYQQFWTAFRQRLALKTHLRRHYYITPYGGGASRTAFETLSLSLYLIRMYEREELGSNEEEMEVIHLDAEALRDVLEKAWGKINLAQSSLKNSNVNYYSLSLNSMLDNSGYTEEKITPAEAILRERVSLPKDAADPNMSAEALYEEIGAFSNRRAADIKNRNRREFDKIMQEYLRRRDETRENDVETEFENLKTLGVLKMTDQSPSKKECDYLVEEKQKEISRVFKKVLASEYINVDYMEEKKKADEAFIEYKKAKALLHRNIIGDIIFMLLAIAAMVVPYVLLQLTSYDSHWLSSGMLAGIASGVFAGLFVVAVILQILPLSRKLAKAKFLLKNYYLNCLAKERYSFSSIRRRYEQDLIYIEHLRYEIRQIKRLYEENRLLDENVDAHRVLLQEVEDCLVTMLNNMDVEPVMDCMDSVDGEFNPNKPIRSRDNRVYQIFSIETIEKMFPKKGSDGR